MLSFELWSGQAIECSELSGLFSRLGEVTNMKSSTDGGDPDRDVQGEAKIRRSH